MREKYKNKSFAIPITIDLNGYGVTLQALVDTGAETGVLIDKEVAATLRARLGLPRKKLHNPLPLADFEGKPAGEVTHMTVGNMEVDGRRFLGVKMKESNLAKGKQVLLGLLWLGQQGVLLDTARRKLVWPPESGPDAREWNRAVTIPFEYLVAPPIDERKQADAERRDRAMDAQIERQKRQRARRLAEAARAGTLTIMKRTELGKKNEAEEEPPRKIPTWVGASFEDDRREGYRKMERALRGEPSPASPKSRCYPKHERENCDSSGSEAETVEMDTPIHIRAISARSFEMLTRRRRSHPHHAEETGFITISIVEKAIAAKKEELLPGDDEETRKRVAEVVERHPYLKPYASVFSKKESNQLPPHRPCDHKIELLPGPELPTSPLYSMSLEQLDALKTYLKEALEKGFIVPSSAPFASPVLFARKADGSWRFCVDYRKLNERTVKNRYPLPLIDETLRQLGRAKYFTKLDIRQAFHRIRMSPESEEMTSFRTRYGQFKYRVMPFGLCNGPATFQAFINSQIFEYLDVFVTAYVDDLIIYSNTLEEHEEHVKLVLEKLKAAGLQADIKKCEFHVQKTRFLGYIVGTHGVEVDPAKIEAVTAWERPKTVPAVQSFLGFCNFYRRFVKDYGRVVRPLQRLTEKDRKFEWTPECEEAFGEIKRRMSSTPVLTHFDPERETRLETDASGGVVAGVLSQKIGEEWHPVGFFSKAMSATEGNYPIHDKELLAIVRSCEEWYPELLSARDEIQILTDHHALQYFMTKRTLNVRQAAWSEFLSAINFKIIYRPGKQNAAADALSRKTETLTTQKAIQEAQRSQVLLPSCRLDPRIVKELPPSPQGLTVAALGEGEDPAAAPTERLHGAILIDRICTLNRTAESLESFREVARGTDPRDWHLREDGLLLKGNRLVVPMEENLRTQLLAEFHEQMPTAHPGRNKMRILVSRQYFWPRMMSDVDRYVRNCMVCRRSHVPRDRPPGLLRPLPIPQRPWQHIAMDFHAMPKDRGGYDQVFVVIDRLTKRAYSIPCYRTTTAAEMARLFYQHVWRTHGAPESIVSDRGPQFISAFWDEFCRILGIELRLASPGHAQTDGQTEIMNQYLDQRLRPFVNHFQDNWAELLPAMDFAQAVLPHESTGLSPMEIETGYPPRMSYDWEERTRHFVNPTEELNREHAQEWASRIHDAVRVAQEHIKAAQEKQKKQADRHRREEDFEIGDLVMVQKDHNWRTNRPSDKLDFPMAGPFKILAKAGNSYKLELPPTWKIHNSFPPDRLRKAPSDPLPGQELQPEPPEEIDGEPEWVVEEILASRIRRGKLEYMVKWAGYDEDLVYYPARNFKGAPHLIEKFHQENPEAAGPPKRLGVWLRAYSEDQPLEDIPDDDLPVDNSPAGRKTRKRRA